MPELNEVACRVADSLDRLIDSITQIDCTNNATGEEQLREQFDYIEDKEIFYKLTLPEAKALFSSTGIAGGFLQNSPPLLFGVFCWV